MPVDEVYRANIARLVDRGSYTAPAHPFPGVRYIAPAGDGDGDAEGEWESVRGLWEEQPGA